MPMCYDKLFERLKNKDLNNGVTTYTLREKKLIGEETLQSLRKGRPIRMNILCRLCYLLNCQPVDIMEYIPDENDVKRND